MGHYLCNYLVDSMGHYVTSTPADDGACVFRTESTDNA